MRVAAVRLRVAACLGGQQMVVLWEQCVLAERGDYCTASEVEGVVTGCPATSTLVDVSGLTSSG